MSSEQVSSRFLAPEQLPVTWMDIESSFSALTSDEQKYAYHVGAASFEGSLICLIQCSPESAGIFNLFQALFGADSPAELKAAAVSDGISEEDFDNLLIYAALFYANMGNYKSFGDTKFIPRVDVETVGKIVGLSSAGDKVVGLFDSVKEAMFSVNEGNQELAMPGQGVSEYFLGDINNQASVDFVNEFLQQQGISEYNTRAVGKNNEVGDADKVCDSFRVLIASAESGEVQKFEHKGVPVEIVTGDHASLIAGVADHLEKAIQYAANDNQKQMLESYVRHFRGGSIDEHKDAQRFWVQDKGPVVESNIGFIESYRDPSGVRGEFEGWVAIVDKEMSSKFASVVANAEQYLETLPWDSSLEKDKFLKPDFTSLQVVAFAGSGIPAGINIPNYDDIRQDFGFKNVSLGNIINAPTTKTMAKTTFLTDEDVEIFDKWHTKAFEVQVVGHELLGHGSGKMLKETEEGVFNFDKEAMTPKTWYKPGETYDSVFGTIGSSLEECRAECVGIVMSVQPEFQQVMGLDKENCEVITYCNWMLMARAGVLALEYYSPESNKWGQAHMQARYAILKTMLEAGLVTIDRSTEGQSFVSVKRDQISEVGVPAVNEFLLAIHTMKCTADAEGAHALYADKTSVDEEMLDLRKEVLARKQPRKIFVQPLLALNEDGDVKVEQFEATVSGVIESMVKRFGERGVAAENVVEM